MTGKFCLNEMDHKEWLEESAKGRLYLDELIDNGYQVSIYSSEVMVPERVKQASSNYVPVKIKVGNYAGMGKDLYKFVSNKYFPDFFKQKYWMFGTEFDRWRKADFENEIWEYDNNIFYSRLKEHGISVNKGKKHYKFIHINGAHFPYLNDENAQKVEANSVSAEQCARGALEIVMYYLGQLKEQDVYDSSSVIIMADHGFYEAGVLTNPVLLVKPRESRGNLDFSAAPVSHDDYAATILGFAGLNQDGSYGRSVLEIEESEERKRMFYQYYLSEKGNNKRLIEFAVSPKSNEWDSFQLTGIEYTVDGRQIDHKKYCESCKTGIQPEILANGKPVFVHEKGPDYPE